MIGLGVMISYIGYEKVERMYYEQIAGVVGKVVAQNPESEVAIAQSLKHVEAKDVARGKEILKPYGYVDKLVVGTHNKSGFEGLLKVNLIAMTSIFLMITAIVYGVYRVLKDRLNHLQGYLMQLARGDYSLNIEGTLEGRFSVFEDQIYKSTLALRESKEEQEKEKLNLARNIADISHQLKTPLTSMGIMTDLLLETELDEQNKSFVESLNRQIERLNKLVQVLLKLAQLDAGTVQLKQQKIVISDLIDEVVDMLEIPMRQKNIQLHLEGSKEVWLKGDRNWMYEAIHNVLYNCVQHSPVGGSITIEWRGNPIYTQIMIQDMGGGVPLEDLPHIFTRFYKGKNAKSDSIGIGLAMAKMIIEKQNGEIKVENTKEGTQFQMKFY